MPATPRKPWTGVYPIAPTPFTESGDVDYAGQRRVLDCMVDQGVDGICVLANYSEQFLLTDAERDTLTELCLAHVAGRVPVIVTVSHFSTGIAVARARQAAAAGARMLMLMPPYHGATLRADEKGMLEHFARVADAAGIPLMVQDAPLSGVTLPVPFLVRLACEVPLGQFRRPSKALRVICGELASHSLQDPSRAGSGVHGRLNGRPQMGVNGCTIGSC